jgi:NAD(P)-dependent dehydrogenase (short-subunit alcohol dehydrogenase family)
MENKLLKNKTAIVTGGTRGIGFEIVKLLGLHGANVIYTGRKKETLIEAQAELEKLNINCLGLQVHSQDKEALQTLVNKTIEHYKTIDIVVNNVATNPVYAPLLELEDSVIDKVLNVNLKSVIYLCQQALPFLKKSKGTIVNIGSIDGIRPEINRSLYGISKAALNALTKALGKELGPFGIRINTICPGIIKTSFSKVLWTDETIKNQVEKNIPISRFGTPEEIANFVLFLASNKSSYCTGGIYIADGGYLL